MRAQATILAALFCAIPALAQVTLPGTVRRPDAPKPAEQPIQAPPAQAPKDNPKGPPTPPSFPGTLAPLAIATPLSDESLTIESAGLTMNLPAGSVMVQGADSEGTVYQIIDEKRAWTIEVKARQTSRAETTVHDVAELAINNYKQLAPVVRPGHGQIDPKFDSDATLLQRLTDFKIAGCPTSGERIYYAVPGNSNGRLIMGNTILKALPTTFVFFELSCDESKFEKARGAYECCVASAKLEDPTKLIASRAAALAAGTEFLSQLGGDKLLKMGDDTERWFRWYRPGKSGDASATEVGYRILKVSKGRRSDIGAEGGSGRDNPSGLVVNTQVRLLQLSAGGKANGVIDSDTKAFVSSDRKDEAWITNTVVRDLKTPNAKPVSYSETGVRSGVSMSIVSRAPNKADSVVQPTLRATQYASVAETPLLGSLLVLDAKAQPATDEEREFGFYAYRADTGTVSLRRDAVSKDATRANAWTVRTRQRDEKTFTLNIYRDDGVLVRSELVDGSVWEPIEPEALLKLWKSKNLPVK